MSLCKSVYLESITERLELDCRCGRLVSVSCWYKIAYAAVNKHRFATMTNYILALGRGIFLMQGFGIAGLADHFK